MNRTGLLLQLAFNVVMLSGLLFLVWPRRTSDRRGRSATKGLVAGPAAQERFEKLRERADQLKK